MKLDNQYAIEHDGRQWILYITSQVESKDRETKLPNGNYAVTAKYYGTLQQLSNAMLLHQIPHTESIEALKDHIDAKVAHLTEHLSRSLQHD